MTLRAPFPYFGGKRAAAAAIWAALGDPGGYVEPFAGSLAVLLARPAFKGGRVETVNDADGWLVNTWRAIQLKPDDVAAHAWGPVTEIDYHARLAWLQDRRGDDLVSWLEGDPEACDPKAAGWWLYVMACGIGDPFGPGPWRVIDGRMTDTRKLPHLGDAGQGVNRELPHLGDAGQGVNRELPHLGDAGRERIAAEMRRLSHRLQHVRITCGDFTRVLTPAASRSKRGGDGSLAYLLDPPYATSGDLYHEADTDGTLSTAARQWAQQRAEDDPNARIIICGYHDEHDALLADGWRKTAGKATTGGYGSVKADTREALWLSPGCLGVHIHDRLDLGLDA